MSIDGSNQFPTLLEQLHHSGALIARGAAPAFTFMDDVEGSIQTLSFADLEARVRALAGHVQQWTQPHDRVLLVLPPSLDYIVGFLACIYAGVVAVPALPPSGSKAWPRLSRIAADAQPSLALAHAQTCRRTDPARSGGLETLTWLAIDELPATGPTWRCPQVLPDDAAFLQYTSGSTGSPKGVIVSHSNILANIRLIHSAFNIRPSDTVVSWLPPHHDMGLIGKIIYPVCIGAHAVHLTPSLFLRRPLAWLQAISDHQARISSAPDFAYAMCAEKVQPEQAAQLKLGCWEFALNGAEPIRARTMQDFARVFAVAGFEASAFTPVYGLAEATLLVCAARPASSGLPLPACVSRAALGHDLMSEPIDRDDRVELVSVGSPPQPDHQVRVVDPASLRCLPAGQVGEIWISGPSVARAYWRQQPPGPMPIGGRLPEDGASGLLTGDLGVLKGGQLFITGRRKDLLILQGRNLYPQDLEQTIEQLDPSFRPAGCAVIAVERASGPRLVVLQEVERRQHPQIHDLWPRVLAELAEVHDVIDVESMLLIRAGRLPRTSSGKIQRNQCQLKYLAAEFEAIWDSRQVAPVPETRSELPVALLQPVEASLQRIFAALLAADSVPTTASFFELGGHSLLATQIVARVQDTLGVHLPLRAVFEAPTIERLAQVVARVVAQAELDGGAAPGALQPMARAPRDAVLPLSFAQQRLWFLDQLLPGTSQYNIAGAVRLQGRLDLEALQRSLSEIVRRHESLRTRFVKHDGQPAQHIDAPAPVALPVLELPVEGLPVEDLSVEDLPARVQAAVQQHAQAPFDLAGGPLLRTQLLRLGPQDHVLALSLHHIVADGWSMGLLITELCSLYTAFVEHRPSPLPELPVQYADFALWQRQWLSGSVLDEQLAYWRAQLDGAPTLLNLPTDRPRASTSAQAAAGASVEFALPAHTTHALNALAQQHHCTLFMVLMAAWQLLLWRYSQQRDVCVGTPIANRNRADIEPLIGCFVNTLVLRTRVQPELRFVELLAQLRTTALDAYAHQDLPFESLVDALKPERHLSHSPLFQVMFVLQNTAHSTLSLPGLRTHLLPEPEIATKFDLTLSLQESADGLHGHLTYSTALFDATTIERMARHWRHLLLALLDNPQQRLDQLDILEPQERSELLGGFGRPWATLLPTPWVWPEGLSAQQVCGLRLLDAELHPCPIGVSGQIHLLCLPDSTPLATGCMARWLPDGQLLHLGAMPAPTPPSATSNTPADYVEPHTPLQQGMAQIWAEVLGLPRVGIHDNFFRIGGQSLLAVVLFSHIESRLGHAIPIEELFKTPTIAELCAFIEQPPANAASDAPATHRPDQATLLVPLSGAADAPPLYCVHALGGSVMPYQALAQRLGEAHRVWGIQAPEQARLAERFETYTDMVQTYTEAILHNQANGPYRLVGWSSGGVLARDIALHLERKGSVVSYLGLIDSMVDPDDAEDRPDSPDAKVALDAALSVLMTVRGRPYADTELDAMLVDLQALGIETDELLAAQHRQALLPFVERWTGMQATLGLLDVLAEQTLITRHYMSLRPAAPVAIPAVRAHLMRASTTLASIDRATEPPVAVGAEVDTDNIEGDHYSIMRAPHVEALSTLILARSLPESGLAMPAAQERTVGVIGTGHPVASSYLLVRPHCIALDIASDTVDRLETPHRPPPSAKPKALMHVLCFLEAQALAHWLEVGEVPVIEVAMSHLRPNGRLSLVMSTAHLPQQCDPAYMASLLRQWVGAMSARGHGVDLVMLPACWGAHGVQEAFGPGLEVDLALSQLADLLVKIERREPAYFSHYGLPALPVGPAFQLLHVRDAWTLLDTLCEQAPEPCGSLITSGVSLDTDLMLDATARALSVHRQTQPATTNDGIIPLLQQAIERVRSAAGPVNVDEFAALDSHLAVRGTRAACTDLAPTLDVWLTHARTTRAARDLPIQAISGIRQRSTGHSDPSYFRLGDGPQVLLLVNAFGLSPDFWAPLANTLPPEFSILMPHRLVRADQADSLEGSYYSTQDFVTAYLDEVRTILRQEGLEHLHVMSWCGGAKLAIELAAALPAQVRSLMLLAPSFAGQACPEGADSAYEKSLLTLCSVVERMPKMADSMANNMRSIMDKGAKDLSRFQAGHKDHVDVLELFDRHRSELLYQPFLTGDNLSQFSQQLLRFRSHDVSHLLPVLAQRELPVLLVTGQFDTTTSNPRATAICQSLGRGLISAQLDDASHYLPYQNAQELWPVIDSFCRSRTLSP